MSPRLGSDSTQWYVTRKFFMGRKSPIGFPENPWTLYCRTSNDVFISKFGTKSVPGGRWYHINTKDKTQKAPKICHDISTTLMDDNTVRVTDYRWYSKVTKEKLESIVEKKLREAGKLDDRDVASDEDYIYSDDSDWTESKTRKLRNVVKAMGAFGGLRRKRRVEDVKFHRNGTEQTLLDTMEVHDPDASSDSCYIFSDDSDWTESKTRKLRNTFHCMNAFKLHVSEPVPCSTPENKSEAVSRLCDSMQTTESEGDVVQKVVQEKKSKFNKFQALKKMRSRETAQRNVVAPSITRSAAKIATLHAAANVTKCASTWRSKSAMWVTKLEVPANKERSSVILTRSEDERKNRLSKFLNFKAMNGKSRRTSVLSDADMGVKEGISGRATSAQQRFFQETNAKKSTCHVHTAHRSKEGTVTIEEVPQNDVNGNTISSLYMEAYGTDI